MSASPRAYNVTVQKDSPVYSVEQMLEVMANHLGYQLSPSTSNQE